VYIALAFVWKTRERNIYHNENIHLITRVKPGLAGLVIRWVTTREKYNTLKYRLFTIYTGKLVGLPFGSVWANGKQISVLGKFRSGLALTICRNPYHLSKNLHPSDG